MSGFKIEDGKGLWRFVLIPSNNNHQPMGYSVDYATRDECKEAVLYFKRLVKEKHIDSSASPYIRIDQNGEKCVYTYYDESDNALFSGRPLAKENCEKDINSIYNRYIDKPVLQD